MSELCEAGWTEAEHNGIATLRAERERARNALANMIASFDTMEGLRNDAEARAGKAEATLDAVRELHKPETFNGRTVCSSCEFQSGPEEYPCPTVRALEVGH